MCVRIDVKDRKPIYEQLVDSIKDLIVQGIWPRDTQLPSVRQLANELAINPNTIQKAYSELERQGIIYSLKSKGSFVASSVEELKKAKKDVLLTRIEEDTKELEKLGVNRQEIAAIILEGGAEN